MVKLFLEKIYLITVLTIISFSTFVFTTPVPDDDFDHSGDYPSDEINISNHQQQHTIFTKVIPKEQQQEHYPNHSLQNDINEFIELIPINDVKKKLFEYYKNDRDVQQFYDYTNGKEFLTIKKRLFDVREIKEFQQYLNDIGLNIKEIFHKLDNLLGISKLKPPPNRNQLTHTTIGGIYGLLEDTLGLLPQDEIFILFFEKLDSSVEFANFVENIGSAEFGKRFDALKKCTELKRVSMELHKHKIDMKKIIELFQSFFLFGTFK